MQRTEELLNKYNAPVPRYTSYPPANHFKDFSADQYSGLIKASNNSGPSNISFYIHIPFCKRICYYCGCNSCSPRNDEQIDVYINTLRKEIRMVSALLDKSRKVSQIHYGGGTPNSIDLNYLHEINDLIRSEFSFIENPETAIECNPEFLDPGKIDALFDAGFNRFSLGIQDFDNNVLRKVNRGIPAIPASELTSCIKEKDRSASVNFDFIYGLPGQTVTSFSDTISKAVAIRPDRIVTFSYAHVPWLKRHQLILEKRGLPDTNEKMQMFLEANSILVNGGYKPLGLDHFVLPEDDLYVAFMNNSLHRNFQGYCTKRTTGQVYAFGVTGISQFHDGYSQNAREIQEYISAISNGEFAAEKGYILDENQKVTREIITRLMCNKRIFFPEIAEELKLSVRTLRDLTGFNEARFADMAKDELLVLTKDGIEVTGTGTMFIRNIAARLDREYIEKESTFSKTV